VTATAHRIYKSLIIFNWCLRHELPHTLQIFVAWRKSLDEQEEIARLRGEGQTLQQIANRFGKSIYWVNSRLNLGYQPKRLRRTQSLKKPTAKGSRPKAPPWLSLRATARRNFGLPGRGPPPSANQKARDRGIGDATVLSMAEIAPLGCCVVAPAANANTSHCSEFAIPSWASVAATEAPLRQGRGKRINPSLIGPQPRGHQGWGIRWRSSQQKPTGAAGVSPDRRLAWR
jgi:hypothetical protein